MAPTARLLLLLSLITLCVSDCSINPILTEMQTAASLPARPKSSNCAGSVVSSGSICNIITSNNDQNYLCDKLICQGVSWTPSEGRCILKSENIHFTVDLLYSGVPTTTTADDLRDAFQNSLGGPSGGVLQLLNLSTTPNAQLVLSGGGIDQARVEVVSKGITVNAMRQLITSTYSQYASAPNGFLSLGTVTKGPMLSYQEQATRGVTPPPQSTVSPQQTPPDDDEIDWLPLLLGIIGGLCLLLILYLIWRLMRRRKLENEKSSLDGKEAPFAFADGNQSGVRPTESERELDGMPDGSMSASQKKYFITAAPDVIVSRGSPSSSMHTSPLTNGGSPSWRRRGLDSSMEGIDSTVTRINDPLLHL